MIPGSTRKLAHTDSAVTPVNCMAIEAVGGAATFTTLKEGGATSPLQTSTLAEDEIWFSYNLTFTEIDLASGTINYHMK